MTHLESRLKERGVYIPQNDLDQLARDTGPDAAVCIGRVPFQGHAYSDESNGEMVVLIVRKGRPKTVMFRRLDQPFTPFALRVEKVVRVKVTQMLPK